MGKRVVKDSFAVIGLGQFGSSICESLVEGGQEVLAIDSNEDVVNEFADKVMRAVIADGSDEEALRELDIGSFDHVYISIGRNMQASILATLIVIELGAKDVIARAENENHARVLEKIGATHVVRPERDIAKRLVYRQLHPTIGNILRLNEHITLAEINITNPKMCNKTLAQLDLTNRYGLNVVAITDKNNWVTQLPTADSIIEPNEKIMVVGDGRDIEKFENDAIL
ncbi:TrkA domain-containing protein [Ligilactobacillus hayakitensis DSM 18933 = JCM 14209]|uniref:TrkA domain-containing protein n=1 Tax=Ligilactobacillus hayakitensis DSM 18933 = JCM 14209 TaxID=1423755 RepID=A0A0R1WNP7_9LACO|nr:TrkA family potassium uptake protein [Ligilactobacillus hayakitensis]KRM19511.1 TrkA domain-containing protein [Ligilactobacillus hayakitensis DSM 18933 = JCM 14209]